MPPQITVVDPWHWLTESGGFPPDPRLRTRVLRVAQCIEAGGPLPTEHTRETLIPCRRRPQGTPCLGLLWVVKETSGAIHAFCPTCRTGEFLIHNWEETDWAEGPMQPVRVEEVFEIPGEGQTKAGPEALAPEEDSSDPLARALASMETTMKASEVRRMIASAGSPTEVVNAILDTLARPPRRETLERLLPILMDTWNETPRPELGGRTPEQVHRAGREPARVVPKVGRNAPCPCGSGKKFKRCCGTN